MMLSTETVAKDVPSQIVYPLTLFDGMYAEVGITMGWLVDGRIDVAKIHAALDRVIAKWPMLGGRLEQESKHLLRLRIPLGSYSPGYKTHIVTSRISTLPLSHYVPIPLPSASNLLPLSILMDENTPNSTRLWVSKCLPLMYWHITYFEKEENGSEYSCIGLTFPHAVLDGLGVSSVVHALEAELLGKEWTAPRTPVTESNENTLDFLLSGIVKEQELNKRPIISDYHDGSLASMWYIIKFLLWHLWQQMWHKTQSRTILIPETVYTRMVEDVRKAMALEGKDDVQISAGDVLSAFIFKTAFSDGTNPKKRVHVTNLASLRRFFAGEINDYIHNAIVPLPYPLLTVGELASISLASLSHKLAQCRHKITVENGAEFYKLLHKATGSSKSAVPYDIRADENIMMSNVTMAHIVDIDWSGAGAGRTLCRYKAVLNEIGITFTNVVTVAGKLHGGTLVLDTIFSQKRMAVFEAAVAQLIADYSRTV